MNKQSIISPLPGIFYRRPNPEEPEYVKVGDTVQKGDIIGLIEVMKNFYEIKAEEDGIIEKFHVENEGLLEAGQEIASLRINKE